jgi:hypothetical protein
MIQKTWQRTEKPVRITYICIIIAILMIWYGIRYLSYYNGSININCHSVACELIIYPIGFQKKIQLVNIPRQQFVHVQPVKTWYNGTFVTDQNIELQDTSYKKKKNNKKYGKHQSSSYSKSASYKGPDSNGHYLSYALVLQDKNPNTERHIGMIHKEETTDTDGNDNDIPTIPEVDLTPILPFLQKMDDNDNNDLNNHHDISAATPPPKYRLIPKLFGARHSQRRVRSMINKIDTYIKFRRQKLVIIETATPAWQGIVLIVMGTVTVLITCTLGQFTNDTDYYYQQQQQYRGPGMRNSITATQRRREQLLQKHNPSPSTTLAKRKVTLQSVHQIATPSQYEVSTAATATATTTTRSRSTTGTNHTTSSVRTTRPSAAMNMNVNPNLSYRKAVTSAHAR